MTAPTAAFYSRRKLSAGDTLALVWGCLMLAASAILLLVAIQQFARIFGSALETNVIQSLVVGFATGAAGIVIGRRYLRMFHAVYRQNDFKRARQTMKLDMVQVLLLAILATVLFPVVWIFSMSLDPRDISRPTGLTIIPPGASLKSYAKVITQPSPNPVSFLQLFRNSMLVAGGTASLAVVIGTTAAYAFSRFIFPGRKLGMLGFVIVLMLPPGATLAPLFVLLNAIQLRTTLIGLMIAYASSALPFAIWNMKGFIDSLPYDLEEAAQIDGCTRTQAFIRVVLPLAIPGMVVTALWGFLTGWSEFILAWTFLTDPSTFTLPMVLRGMTGQYASGTPWSQFAAMSIMMSLPAVVMFFFLQRYLVAGLAAGGVKG